MNTYEIAKKFTHPYRGELIHRATRGGYVYATDGKILFKGKINFDHDPVVTDESANTLPDQLERIIANRDPGLGIAHKRFRLVEKSMLENEARYQEALAEFLAYSEKDDYEELVCPCCGETVFYKNFELFDLDDEDVERTEDDFEYNVNVGNVSVPWRHLKRVFDVMPQGVCRIRPSTHCPSLICETADAYILAALPPAYYDEPNGIVEIEEIADAD